MIVITPVNLLLIQQFFNDCFPLTLENRQPVPVIEMHRQPEIRPI